MRIIIQILAIGGFIGLTVLTALIISLNSIVAELEQDNYNEVYHFIPVQHDMVLGQTAKDEFVIQETGQVQFTGQVQAVDTARNTVQKTAPATSINNR